VDDIIFGSDMEQFEHKFAKCMQIEFEISIIGEISFFLSLQISQSPQGVYLSIQISQGNFEEVWARRLQASEHTYDYKIQIVQRR